MLSLSVCFLTLIFLLPHHVSSLTRPFVVWKERQERGVFCFVCLFLSFFLSFFLFIFVLFRFVFVLFFVFVFTFFKFNVSQLLVHFTLFLVFINGSSSLVWRPSLNCHHHYRGHTFATNLYDVDWLVQILLLSEFNSTLEWSTTMATSLDAFKQDLWPFM